MKIRGRIFDARLLRPLTDVVVTARGPGDSTNERTVVSGADGSFEFLALAEGPYRLHLEKEGHQVQDAAAFAGEQVFTLQMEPVRADQVTVLAGAPPSPQGEGIDLARARCAYFAYGRTTDFKNFAGGPMPRFDDLPELIRQAWINAAASVIAASQPGGQLARVQS